MTEPVQRFDIPTKGRENLFEVFKAFREWAKKQAEAQGKTLDPGWYPEDHPEKWEDEPELLESLGLTPKSSAPTEQRRFRA